MSSSEADVAKMRAEAVKAAKEAEAAKAEADAAERVAEEAKRNAIRIAEEKAALNLAEKEIAGRLAAKEEEARTKVSAAKAAWEKTKDAFRDFETVEPVMKSALYRAVSAAASAKAGQNVNPTGFPDMEDSLDNVERAIELLSPEGIDPRSEYTESNSWKDLTRNERVAWKVVMEEMKRYMNARDAWDSAISAAYEAASEAAEAEMERLREAAKVNMLWYGAEYSAQREIRRLIRRCLASTVMPNADEIVRQIRSSIRVMQGLDIFFEIDAVMILLRYEGDWRTDKFQGVELYWDEKNDRHSYMISVSTIRHFHSTIRRLKEISDGLEAIRRGRVNGKGA